MKRILFLLLNMLTMAGYAQYPVTSINITMPGNTPANTADWATAMPPVMITAQAQMRNGQVPGEVAESKILVTIKQDGSKKYGSYTADNAPSAGFTTAVKNWSGSTAISLLGKDVILSPGTYELCVQFFSYNTPAKPLSNEVCKTFTIQGSKDEQYSPPVNINPVDKKVFDEKEIKEPITFRWTPVVPKPQNVIYRLKVWQLMQGQTASQAMQTAQPIIQEEVKDQTQFMYRKGWDGTVKGGYVWRVEATDGKGKVLGVSEATGFSVLSGGCQISYDAKIDSIVCVDYNHAKVYGKFICIKSGYGPSSGYTVFPTQINAANIIAMPSNTTIGTLLSVGTVNEGNNFPVMIVSTIIPTGTTGIVLKFDAIILDPQHNCTNVATADSTMPDCRCKPCKLNNVIASNQSMNNLNSASGTVSIMNNLGATPNNITKIQADIVFIKIVPKDAACVKCDKQPSQQGNFLNLNRILTTPAQWSGSGNAIFPANAVANTARSVTYTSANASGVNISGNILIRHTLGLPPVGCCGDDVEVWIRYTVWDIKCNVCDDKLVKSTLSRPGTCGSGTNTGNGNSRDNNNSGQ